EAGTVGVSVNPADGSYTVFDPAGKKSILHARIAAEIDNQWVKSSDYPRHSTSRSSVNGPGTNLTVTNTGLGGHPDLIYTVEAHNNPDFVTVAAIVRNTASTEIKVQVIRTIEALGPTIVDLGGPQASDRVLSDSFSEDRPGIKIHDLADATNGMHRAVGS